MGRNLKQLLGSQLWRLADLTRAGATRREFRSRAYRQAVWSLDEISPTWKSRSRSCWPCAALAAVSLA